MEKPETAAKKPIIIYDTDMDTDCDDVGALAILCEYVRAGRAELLGVVADAAAEEAAPCCEAILRHYRLDVPVGAVHPDAYPAARTEKYRAIRATMAPARYYNRPLAEQVGKSAADYPRAELLYRELLARAEDGSVTVAVVGFPTALAELLSEEAGRALFARKVTRVVSMTNAAYPAQSAPNFNYDTEPFGTHGCLENCPVPIFASPDGTRVITGAHLTDTLPAEHPLRLSYELYMEGERRGRSSWDLIAVLFALEPNAPCFTVTHYPGEQMAYDPALPRLFWRAGERGDAIVKTTLPPEEMAELLNRRMLGDFS